MTGFSLQHVHYMPREFVPGVLYASREYAIAGHLCACGCGEKIMTPLLPAEWSLKEENGLPSLWPSIGNWQLPCRSHYIIHQGKVRWAGQWTEAQILAGREGEQHRRNTYYADLDRQRGFWWQVGRAIKWLFGIR